MLVTKYTYLYRAIATVGFLLAIGAIFAPWIAIESGQVGDFGDGATPTGWQLVNLNLSGPFEQNLFGYLFVGLWVVLVVGALGAILAVVGRDPRGMGAYVAMLAIGYLVLMLFLLPTIQATIPLPPDGCTPEQRQAIADALADGDSATAQRLQQACDALNLNRERVLTVKETRLLPTFGAFLAVAGGVVAFIGGRLVARDTEKIGRMRTYHELLVEAHKDGRITVEEEDLLAVQRRIYGINRDEHETVLRHMFPEQHAFEDAVYMHQNPIDVDRLLLERNLQDYGVYAAQAYRKGAPSAEEREMLAVIRSTLNISRHDHEMILANLAAEGKIPPAPRGTMREGHGGWMAPEGASPAATAAIEPPPPARPLGRAAAAPPAVAPPLAPTPKRVKCPNCKGPIEVASEERPLPLNCPSCGHSGMLRR